MIWLLRLAPVLAALVCIGLAFLPERKGRIAHPAYTNGIVVAHRTQKVHQHGNETDVIAPVVRYGTPSGEITAVSRDYLPEWQYRHYLGDTVQVCYDTKQPDLFHLCRIGGEWRKGLLLTIGIGTLVAYGVLWMQFR